MKILKLSLIFLFIFSFNSLMANNEGMIVKLQKIFGV
jgi:hypothetical protein